MPAAGVSVNIDGVHARAICEEIGDRLREALRRSMPTDLPPRLQFLLNELARVESEMAPSIVPTLAELAEQSDPALA